MQITIGSVTVTNGSQRVIGTVDSANPFSGWGNISEGNIFTIQGSSVPYNVSETTPPATSESGFWELTLSSNYMGATASGLSYAVVTDFTPNFGLPLINRGDKETNTIFSRAMALVDAFMSSGNALYAHFFSAGDCVVGSLGTYSPTATLYITGLELNLKNAPTGSGLTIQMQDNLGNNLGISVTVNAGQSYARVLATSAIEVSENALTQAVVTSIGSTYSGSDINLRVILSGSFIPGNVLALLTPTSNRVYLSFPLEGDAVVGNLGEWVPDIQMVAIGMEINATSAPTGANLMASMYLNGSESGYDGTLAAGSTYQQTFFPTPLVLAPGFSNRVNAYITQVGSTFAGQNVEVRLILANPAAGIIPANTRAYLNIIQNGDATVGAMEVYTPDTAMYLYGIEINAGTAPTGANLLVEIYQGASAIAATVATLTANSVYQKTTFGSAVELNYGVAYTIEITQVGSTYAGQNIKVRLSMSPVE